MNLHIILYSFQSTDYSKSYEYTGKCYYFAECEEKLQNHKIIQYKKHNEKNN